MAYQKNTVNLEKMLGFRFSKNGWAERAREALDEAVAYRFQSPLLVPTDLELRTDNGSQFGASYLLMRSID